MSLKVENVSVSLTGRRILEDLSFCCRAGEITAIVGENGAGKSTLMNCLAGVAKYQGEITLDGRSLRSFSLAELAQHRAVLPQQSSLNFPFSVREVVRLAMSLTSLSHHDQESIIADSLASVDASQFLDREYLQLSGGEKQRVQLARVLAQLRAHDHDGSRFLFLDEPTSALDIKHQYSTLKLLQSLARVNHIGVLVIVHDLNLASFYCDKVLLLKDGKLVKHDSPERVFRNHIVKDTFDIDVWVDFHPDTQKSYLIPKL